MTGRSLLSLIRNVLRGRALDHRVRDELRAHAEMLADEEVREGIEPVEARRRALAAMGSLPVLREQVLEARRGAWVEHTWRDFLHALRRLRRAPVFTAVVLVTLAVGIGANAAVFQLIDAVLLRPLPVHEPQALVDIRLADRTGTRGSFNTWRQALTWPIWEQVRTHGEPFDGVFAWGTGSHNLATDGEVRMAEVLRLSSNAFEVLGVPASVGRVFTGADDRTNCGATGVVISDAFWDREYARDAGIAGRTITLSARSFSIIGVTPAWFTGLAVGESFDVAVPLCAESYLNPDSARSLGGTVWWLSIVGRLKQDWTVARAADYLSSVSPGVFAASLPPGYPAVNVPHYLAFKLVAEPFGSGVSSLREDYTTPLMLLLGIAGVVLLTACGNIANLLLAQGTTQEREMSVRLALGASRGRLVRQSLIYSLVLASAGAALGVLVAGVLGRVMVALLSTSGRPVFLGLQTDWRLLGVASVLALLTCAIFGVAPALRATDANPAAALAAPGRGNTASRRQIRLRRGLVAGQVALSLVLVVGALLFASTLRNLSNEEIGFESAGLIVADMGFEGTRLPAAEIPALRERILAGIREAPGIDRAAAGLHVPLMGGYRSNRIWPDGASDRALAVSMGWIGDRYFETLGVPMLAGREFDSRERPDSLPTGIINQTLAARLFGDTNPIGRILRLEATPTQPEIAYTIVGLVADTKYRGLREPAPPVLYTPLAQAPVSVAAPRILLRSTLPAQHLAASLRRAAATADSRIAVSTVEHAAHVRQSLVRERMMATLSGFFGALGAGLAMLGLYGVMSYIVATREREIGVRLALGARRGEVLLMVLRQAATLFVVGIAGGMAVAMLAARGAQTMLFGLASTDPLVYAASAGLLAIVMALAAGVPGIRAARVDPARALRND